VTLKGKLNIINAIVSSYELMARGNGK